MHFVAKAGAAGLNTQINMKFTNLALHQCQTVIVWQPNDIQIVSQNLHR